MNNEIYLVGILPEQEKKKIFKYQENISEVYNLYGNNYPELHITFSRFIYPDKSIINTFINKLETKLHQCKPIDICVLGACCFDHPYKSVNLHVESSPQLEMISEMIKNTADLSGLLYNMPFEKWNYHISLANPAFAQKEWSIPEYEEACIMMKNENPKMTFRMNHLQLWYPISYNYVIHDFYLKE